MGGFPDLPSEIRHQIWLMSIPNDEAEVCLPWPVNVPHSAFDMKEPLYTLPCQPLTVDVAFPVAMHVCRESRDVVLDTRRSGVRFRASQAAGCPTPFRCFRPELDVLYLSDSGIDFVYMFVWPECTPFDSYRPPSPPPGNRYGRNWQLLALMETLVATRRFAITASSIPGRGELIKDFFAGSWDAQLPRPTGFGLCYVVPTTKNLHDMEPGDVHTAFVPPGRRCRLARIDKCDWSGVFVPTDKMRFQPPQTLEEVVTETIEEIRAVKEGRHLGKVRKWPQPEITDMLDVTAATFVEYQRDGTWTEVCAGRMYPRDRMELPEIPPDERPDPEIQRMYDADIELRLVPCPWTISSDEEYSDDE